MRPVALPHPLCYRLAVPLLRRAWLIAIVGVAVVGAGAALAMRWELLDPGGTLTPYTYSGMFELHALAMVGVMIAAFVAIPSCLIRPGRGAVVLGVAFLAVWAIVMAYFVGAALAPDDVLAGPRWLHAANTTLGAGAIFAIAQLAMSIRPSAQRIPAIAGLIALVIVAIPLVTGDPPTRSQLLAAGTLVAGSLALTARESPLVWIAIAPGLATAWIITMIVQALHVSFLPDTTAVVAPFPALGGAVLAALFVAAAPDRRPRVAAVLFTVGSISTSAGLLVLGLRGMPRRYQQYDPDFQHLHILVGVAAAVTVIGAMLALLPARTRR